MSSSACFGTDQRNIYMGGQRPFAVCWEVHLCSCGALSSPARPSSSRLSPQMRLRTRAASLAGRDKEGGGAGLEAGKPALVPARFLPRRRWLEVEPALVAALSAPPPLTPDFGFVLLAARLDSQQVVGACREAGADGTEGHGLSGKGSAHGDGSLERTMTQNDALLALAAQLCYLQACPCLAGPASNQHGPASNQHGPGPLAHPPPPASPPTQPAPALASGAPPPPPAPSPRARRWRSRPPA